MTIRAGELSEGAPSRGTTRLVHGALLCTMATVACGHGTLGTSPTDGGSGTDSSISGEAGSSSGVGEGGSGSTSSSGLTVDSGGDGPGESSDGSSDSSSGSIFCFEAPDAGSDGGCSCFGADDGGDGGTTYRCTQEWIRSTSDCTIPYPPAYPGFIDMDGGSWTFSMKVAGDCVEVFGSFMCSGTWNANGFSCTITGEFGAGPNEMCPGVQFSLMTSGVLPSGMTLQPGQIGVLMSGFSALCQ